MSVNVVVLLALGLVGGFLSGLFGVGGGFLLTPLLAFIGVPPSIAVGTQANQLVGTSLAGTMAHWKRRNIDIRMGLTMLIGSLVGTTCGAELFRYLSKIGHINLAITIGYVAMLGGIGSIMFFESSRAMIRCGKEKQAHKEDNPKTIVAPENKQIVWGGHGLLAMDFPASHLRMNVLVPVFVGFVGGVMVAMLGIGGGFILVPAMIYILRMPPILVNGTSLFQIIFATAFSTLLQAVINHSVDIMLAMVLLAGSVVGVPFGTRMASHMNPVKARFLLALVILAVAAKLLVDLMLFPDQPFSLETRLM
jgi:uncharacterized membrane protein YfcA